MRSGIRWVVSLALLASMVAPAAADDSPPAPTWPDAQYSPSTDSILLNWTYPDTAVDGFAVYLNGDLLGTTTSTTYVDPLENETPIREYRIAAIVDGDEGPRSNALIVVLGPTGAIKACPIVGITTYPHHPFIAYGIHTECIPNLKGSSE